MAGSSKNQNCKHCGESCYGSASDFCCKGCEVVYSLVQSNSLDLVNKAVASEKFDYLDNSEFIQKFSQTPNQMEFYLEGIHCSQCLWILEQLPNMEQSILTVELDMSKNVVTVLKSEKGRFSTVAQLFSALGYKPHPINGRDDSNAFKKREERSSLIKLGVAAFCAGNLMLMSISLYSGAEGFYKTLFEWLSLVLFFPVVFYSATPFWKTLWRFVFLRKPHVDIPIGVALFFGSIFSLVNLIRGNGEIYFDSLAALVALILATRYFLIKVKNHYLENGHLVSFLLKQSVTKIVDGHAQSVAAEKVQKNDVLEFYRGERFPVDGKVLSNEVLVNMAVYDGESLPKVLFRGDKIISGTQLLSGCCQVQALDTVRASYLGKMLEDVEKEAFKKKGVVHFADKYSKYFTMFVLAVSLVLFLVGSFALGVSEALSRSLALIIIACPCALAFSLPLVQSVSLLKASAKGILIKTVDVFEKLKSVKSVFFDKTGTLTEGHFKVIDQSKLISKEQAEIILALELKSNHPVALTLVQYVRELYDQLTPANINQYEEILGYGVKAQFNGAQYELGFAELAAENKNNSVIVNQVAFKKDNDILTVFSLGDEVLSESASVIHSMKEFGMRPILLSGDSQRNVEAVARIFQLNVEEQYFRLSPDEKLKIVQSHNPAVMIGDGLNDTLALAHSEVGIAVNGSMEASLKVADVYLLKPQVSLISELFVISMDVNRVIHRNLTISFLYNVIAGLFAMFGYIEPLMAAILMPVSSLVILISTLSGVGYFSKSQADRFEYTLKALESPL